MVKQTRVLSPIRFVERAIRSFSLRNLAFASSIIARLGRPQYSDWSVRKAVKDGYKVNGWVYRAVNLTSKNGASVPWGVVNEKGELVEEHHLTKLLKYPNPFISRQDLFELWISWLELTGNAPGLKVGPNSEALTGGTQLTKEMWPVSPDRIKPVPSKDMAKWLDGYALDNSQKVKWTPQQIIHFKYLDPADPYWGIGPLQAAGKVVDIDTDQKNWNKSAMENRGVLDGVFTFKREFSEQSEADELADQINERYAGRRRIGVLGSEAKWQRTAMTPAEMDFGMSRKANRDEIFVIFGIPPQYAGALEASTYNNYQTSELIFWFQKVIPLLDDLRDTFNFSFRNELKDNEMITYFLDGVDAIRRAWLERVKIAKYLFEMGVPFDRLNRVFKLSIEEYEGWSTSYPGGKPIASLETTPIEGGDGSRQESVESEETRSIEYPEQSPFREMRESDGERFATMADSWALSQAPKVQELLDAQKRTVFSAIEEAADEFGRVQTIYPENLLGDTFAEDWKPVFDEIARGFALIAADSILIEERQLNEEIQRAVEEYLEGESAVLQELSHIEATTVASIIEQVESAKLNGLTVTELQQAIIDAGILEPARALRLSRTITGTAGSMGQWASANKSGATHKTWLTAGDDNVRDAHEDRQGETVGINATFSKRESNVAPRYPLDPNLSADDRVHCRCSMGFSIQR